ncbi:MAG: PGRS family protein [Polyangiaceae bacterium]
MRVLRLSLSTCIGALTALFATGCFDYTTDPAAFCQGLSCGVFVSSSMGNDDTGDGTRNKPYATLSKAVSIAEGNLAVPVYACGEEFADAVTITSSTVLYGGLDCEGDWKAVAEKATTVRAPADAIPLRVSGGGDVKVFQFAFIAADATAAGGSSIGVVVGADTTVELTSCTIQAGNGAPGADSAADTVAAADGVIGTDGASACSAAAVEGGASPTTACDTDQSTGGQGAGQTTNANTGDITAYAAGKGLPGDAAGGATQTSAAVCTNGADGTDGADGADADGARSLGTLSATAGLIPESADGGDGAPGGGGGGGGASLGGEDGGCSAVKSGGASGGSGGTGGCGGKGGKGGVAGGSSIGLVSVGATVTLKDVTIQTGNGDDGGDGAVGQEGGKGAAGGKGGGVPSKSTHSPGCSGGAGGAGGKGGKGGGGLGGHSLGIAYLDKAPTTSGTVKITVGTAGKGGAGPGGGAQANNGVAAETQAF